MRVYVAGSSKDIDRCERAVARCREAGFTITEDWVAEMRASAPDAQLDADHLMACAKADIRGVETADVVWLLAPPASKPSAGCWVEAWKARRREEELNPRVVVNLNGPAPVRESIPPTDADADIAMARIAAAYMPYLV